ncbi:MBL fold metallo-hydrolase [Massilia niabensis]|uniref:MBL fold metallo-hydrolase n=1 Tax=Massilia niabensis TaxID=544910 RepID=A0ABW0L650_9BURK
MLGALVAALLAPAAAAPTLPSPAAVPAQARSIPGYYRLLLGQFEVTALSDGTVTLPVDKLLTHTSPAELAPVMQRAGIDPAKAEISINAFLIHTGSRLVLVDAGPGAVFPHAGKLVASLHAAGYHPQDITDVVITHIHGDHSAGLTIQGKAAFPRATVHVQKTDADFWLDPANAARHPRHAHAFAQARLDLAPYLASGRLRRLAGAAEIVPGIRALPTPGHTPGHAFYEVESEGQKLVLWRDLIHGKDAQFHAPGIAIGFDVDEGAAISQRKAAMADTASKGYLVGAGHISFPGIGRVAARGVSYDWLPVNYSEQALRRAGGKR